MYFPEAPIVKLFAEYAMNYSFYDLHPLSNPLQIDWTSCPEGFRVKTEGGQDRRCGIGVGPVGVVVRSRDGWAKLSASWQSMQASLWYQNCIWN